MPRLPARTIRRLLESMLRVFLLILALTGAAARPPPKRCLTSLFGAQPSDTIYATDGLQVGRLSR